MNLQQLHGDADFLRRVILADRRHPIAPELVDRLLHFAQTNRQPVTPGQNTNWLKNIVRQLRARRRLVGWADSWRPDSGTVAIGRGPHGYLITLPENADIATAMVAMNSLSAAGHAVNGLAFGYPLTSVAAYVRSFHDQDWLEKALKKAGLRRFSIIGSDDFSSYQINLALMRADRTPAGRQRILTAARPILDRYLDITNIRDAGDYLALTGTLRQ